MNAADYQLEQDVLQTEKEMDREESPPFVAASDNFQGGNIQVIEVEKLFKRLQQIDGMGEGTNGNHQNEALRKTKHWQAARLTENAARHENAARLNKNQATMKQRVLPNNDNRNLPMTPRAMIQAANGGTNNARNDARNNARNNRPLRNIGRAFRVPVKRFRPTNKKMGTKTPVEASHELENSVADMHRKKKKMGAKTPVEAIHELDNDLARMEGIPMAEERKSEERKSERSEIQKSKNNIQKKSRNDFRDSNDYDEFQDELVNIDEIDLDGQFHAMGVIQMQIEKQKQVHAQIKAAQATSRSTKQRRGMQMQKQLEQKQMQKQVDLMQIEQKRDGT
jgi:hypothetical protein